MSYALVYWLVSSASLVAAPAPIPFADQGACMVGLQTITAKWKSPTHDVVGMCIDQSTPPAPPLAPVNCFTLDAENELVPVACTGVAQ